MASLVKSLDLCKLGYAFFWSSSLYLIMGQSASVHSATNLAWIQQLSLCAAFAITAAATLKTSFKFVRPMIYCAGITQSASALAHVLATMSMPGSDALAVAAGILLGISNALQFLLWQTVYANEGALLTGVYLPLSAVLGSVFCFALMQVADTVSALYLVTVAPFATTGCLLHSFEKMNPYRPRSACRQFVSAIGMDVWRPVVCSVVLCLAWATSKHLAGLTGSVSQLAIAMGFCVASLIVLAIGVRAKYDFGAPSAFRVIFPLLGAALLAPAFFGARGVYILEISLTFGAHLMTLLISIVAASYAAHTQFSPSLIAVMVMAPSQLAILVGDTVGTFLSTLPISSGSTSVVLMASGLFGLLFIVLLVTSHKFDGKTLAEPADDTLLLNPYAPTQPSSQQTASEGSDGKGIASAPSSSPVGSKARKAQDLFHLTGRETDVLELLLGGNTMAAISRKLLISDNTTRGHMKRIYQKLDVHSRQELIDKVDGI